jgi:hypothetical protein
MSPLGLCAVLVFIIHLILHTAILGAGADGTKPMALLTAVKVDGYFLDTMGNVTVTQRWKHPGWTNDSFTGSYTFHLSPGAVVGGLKLKMGDKEWVGKIRERMNASERHRNAVNPGIMSVVLHGLGDGPYEIRVGPIAHGSDVEIVVQYYCLATVRNDGSYQLVVPTQITQLIVDVRVPATRIVKSSTSYYSGSPSTEALPNFEIDIKWTTVSVIKGVTSPSNPIQRDVLTSKSVRIRGSTVPENGDFTLQIMTEGRNGAYTYTNELDATTFLYIRHQIPLEETVLRSVERQITIVLDRSTGMEGEDMLIAVDAVDRFLSLLPTDGSVYVNVVSFGAAAQPLFSSAIAMTAQRIAILRKHITSTFTANFGHVNLLSCLRDVIKGHFSVAPACLDVSAVSESELGRMEHFIVLLAPAGTEYDRDMQSLRIMAIGTGRNVGRKQLQQLADRTNGICEVLMDESDVIETLTDIMRHMDLPYYTDMHVLGGYETVLAPKPVYPSHAVEILLHLDLNNIKRS